MNNQYLLGYTDIYKGPLPTESTLLKGVGCDRALEKMSYFLGYSFPTSINSIETILKNFFRSGNGGLQDHVISRIAQLERKNKTKVFLLNPMSSLSLFEFCYQNLGSATSVSDAEIEVKILKAYLIYNTKFLEKQKIRYASTQRVPRIAKSAIDTLTTMFPYYEFINENLEEVTSTQIVKSIHLFQFLEQDVKYAHILQKFAEYFDEPSWKHVLRNLIPLSDFVREHKATGHITFQTPIRGRKAAENFLTKLCLTRLQLDGSYDFKALRSKPFYKIADGNFRVISKLFVAQLLHKGLYFHLATLNEQQPKNLQIKNFRQEFTFNFSERYLLKRICETFFSEPYVSYDGEKLAKLGVQGEPDYYLRRENNIFLFESKDILIRAEVKVSSNYNLYEEVLKKKFYQDPKSKQKKAILQLVENIKAISNRFNYFEKTFSENHVIIYPIIVVHDNSLMVPGLNRLLNYWFSQEIESLKKHHVTIKPLSLLNIDTLIYGYDLFVYHKLPLDEFLDCYFEKAGYISDPNGLADSSMITISEFLPNFAYDRKFINSGDYVNLLLKQVYVRLINRRVFKIQQFIKNFFRKILLKYQ